MLEPFVPSSIPNRVPSPPPPVVMDGEERFEITEILDSKIDRRFRVRLRYYVRWAGYEGTADEFSWIGADDATGGAQEAIDDYHRAYPDKPGPLADVP